MKRIKLAATVILLVIGLAVTAGETWGQKAGKGKPGGGGDEPNPITSSRAAGNAPTSA